MDDKGATSMEEMDAPSLIEEIYVSPLSAMDAPSW
jgi:hypothetical protein